MTQNIKYLIHKYLPNSIKYLVIFTKSYQQIISIVKQLLSNWKYIRLMETANYFDSTNMTYDKVKKSTFLECYDILKSSNIIYFGEVTEGCHRFVLTDEKIETQLIELLNLGFIIDLENFKELPMSR